MADVFISYSHNDKAYATRLADELVQWGIDPWMDDRIDHGSQWPRVIQESLDACPGFIVIMSFNSYHSDWVQNEVSYAQENKKIIFPLLLSGGTWVSFAAKQYVDVRNGNMPPDKYFKTIREKLGKQGSEFPTGSRSLDQKTIPRSMFNPPVTYTNYESLQAGIVEHILDAINRSSNALWDIGLFRVSFTLPVKRLPKTYKLPNYHSLSSEIINTSLLRIHDRKFYARNRDDLEKFAYHRPAQTEDPASGEFIPSIPSVQDVKLRFEFKKRLNLDLSILSDAPFTKSAIENFADRLIEIHKNHYIPPDQIWVQVIR